MNLYSKSLILGMYYVVSLYCIIILYVLRALEVKEYVVRSEKKSMLQNRKQKKCQLKVPEFSVEYTKYNFVLDTLYNSKDHQILPQQYRQEIYREANLVRLLNKTIHYISTLLTKHPNFVTALSMIRKYTYSYNLIYELYSCQSALRKD